MANLLTVDETADYLNLTPQTVRRLHRDGVLPSVKIGGKAKSRIRFKQGDLDALIESGYRPASTGPLAAS
jgi:excisionase family DNA binding protein